MTQEAESESALENWETFLSRLADFGEEDIRLIELAYELSKAAHRTQEREDGERYFEHPRAVALILLDEIHIKNPNLIIAALIHDCAEDSSIFGTRNGKTYEQWKDVVYTNVAGMFNEEVANILVNVTKPYVDGVEINSERDVDKVYERTLSKSPINSRMVKACDRLHNLRTLDSCKPDKQIRKVLETRRIYLPIFEGIRGTSDGDILFQKVTDELEIWEKVHRL